LGQSSRAAVADLGFGHCIRAGDIHVNHGLLYGVAQSLASVNAESAHS
jgi:hypothetical protein